MDKVRIEVEIERDLVDEAERLGVDVQDEAVAGLRRRLGRPAAPSDEEQRWRKENAEAIAFNNGQIEKHGLWCDDYRTF